MKPFRNGLLPPDHPGADNPVRILLPHLLRLLSVDDSHGLGLKNCLPFQCIGLVKHLPLLLAQILQIYLVIALG